MFRVHGKSVIITIAIVLFGLTTFSQESNGEKDKKILQDGLQILRNYFLEDNNWHLAKPGVSPNVEGLIHFIEDRPIDEIIGNLKNSQQRDSLYVFRLPENVEDSLNVPGFIPAQRVLQNVEQIGINYHNEVARNPIPVPEIVLEEAREQVAIIQEGEGMKLFTDSVYVIPDSLLIPEVIPDSVLNSPEQFSELVRIDSLRNVFIEEKRQFYNDSITVLAENLAVEDYRKRAFDHELKFRVKRYKDSVKLNNYEILTEYNKQVMSNVNDSIRSIIDVLMAYADHIDTTTVSITNLTGETEDVLLQNGPERFSRVWLKNEQNDSLRVMVKTTDKRSMQMLIDDGVTFSRFKEKQTKDFDFESLKEDYSKFSKVGKSYALETPWRIGGDGTAGFTQTYLENWKKGGKSALSLLLVLKGFANYASADGKIKWENSAEIRNGWIRQGGEGSETQKNADKFELTSRYGISAFKKWYYSAEFNFNTQLFNGYKYPKADNPTPISAFLAPAKTYFKVGLDYKPNKNMSLFLSPFSMKNVYVRDTSRVNQVNFGVSENKKAFWEPGLNVDFKYKRQITPDITYETKYKMFQNYKSPFTKFDIDWENLVKFQLTTYLNMQMMIHMIYDDDVKFPVYNDEGTKVGEEAKLQFKEFITIGFNYKINHKVMRTKRIRKF